MRGHRQGSPLRNVGAMSAFRTNGDDENRAALRLPRHIVVLGAISFLTAMSSSMVYGLLPVFLVKVLHRDRARSASSRDWRRRTTSLTKIVSGVASDWLGRRKPLVLLGYALSAVNKVMFPLADGGIDDARGARHRPRRQGHSRRAARCLPDRRDAGADPGIRVWTAAVVLHRRVCGGPLAAMAIMNASGDDFRLVFWIAVIPAMARDCRSVVGAQGTAETDDNRAAAPAHPPRRLALFPRAFWWAVAIASVLSLARFSQAFLVLKAHDIGIDPAFVPAVLVLMYVVYALAAYPFGILADRIDRRLQLGLGAVLLICADIILAGASAVWATALGVVLWGLQMAVTQGLLSASVADAAPETSACHSVRHLRTRDWRRDFFRKHRGRCSLDLCRTRVDFRRKRSGRRGCGPASRASANAPPYRYRNDASLVRYARREATIP